MNAEKPRKKIAPKLFYRDKSAKAFAAEYGYPAGISFYLRYEPLCHKRARRMPAGYYDYRIVARKRSRLHSGLTLISDV